jgi:hypothetical protein
VQCIYSLPPLHSHYSTLSLTIYIHLSVSIYIYQRYRSTVQRIATGSLLLAAMTPHALFASVIVGIKLLLPRAVTWLAKETSVTSLLSWWYPVLATITLLHQLSQEDNSNDDKDDDKDIISNKNDTALAAEQKENNAPPKQRRKQTKTAKTSIPKPRTPFFPRTGPATDDADNIANKDDEDNERGKRRRRRSSFLTSATSTLRLHHHASANPAREVHEWLQYWMVYAAVQALARLLYLLPGSSLLYLVPGSAGYHTLLQQAGLQLQLIFYVWIYVLPYTVLPIPDLPDCRPLVFMTDYAIRPVILSLHQSISGAISLAFWERHVVGKLTSISDALVLIRFLKRETADWWLHVIASFRQTAVPSVTLFMPGMVTNFGVWYVQYCVPLAVAATATATKDNNDNNDKQQQQQLLLQYWVLHALTQGVLEQCRSILWWIPLSTHFIFLLWCYWNLDVSVRQWYPAVQQELQAFGLLPGAECQEFTSTRTSRVLQMVLARLPSAAANEDDENDDTAEDDAGDDANSATANNATKNDATSATAMNANKDDGENAEPDPLLQDKDNGLDDDDDDDDEEQEEYIPETVPKASTPTRGVVTRRSTRQRTPTVH